jgi:hypothetical protein
MDYRDTVMDYWSPEEFLEQLSIHNHIIYRRRKTPNLHRSWILFYERVMVNDVILVTLEETVNNVW